MRMLNRIVRIVALTVPFMLAAGCGTQPADTAHRAAKKVKIGFLVKMPEEPWFQNEWKFARKCADKYGFEVVTIGTPDGGKVLAAIDNMGAQGAQGFVICTPDVKLGPAIVQRARRNNLKVMAVDDRFVGSDGTSFMTEVPYMGISARKIGEMVGKALSDEMRKRGWKAGETAACGVTFDELDTARQRTDGAADVLAAAGFPKDKIYRVHEKTTDVEGGLNAANIVLAQHPDVKRWLVFSMNDEGVMGAVRALENTGRFSAENVIGVGIGGNSCVVEFRKEKPTGFFATVLISPLRHGFETSELMYKWIADGVEPPKETLTEGILVTRETFEKVMDEQGLTDVAARGKSD